MRSGIPSPAHRPAKLFVGFLTARPLLMAAALAMTVLSAVAEMAYPWLLQHGIDAVVDGGGDAPTGWTVERAAIAMVGVIVVVVLGHGITLALQARMFATAAFALRNRIIAHVQRLPLAALARWRSGELAYRVGSDVAMLETGLAELFGDCLFDLLVVLGATLAMASISWRLTIVVVLVMSLATALAERLGTRLPAFKRASQGRAARLAGMMQETIGAIRTIRALTAEAATGLRLAAVNGRLRDLDIKGGHLRALVTPLWHFAETLGVVVVLWYAGGLVMAHAISVGTLIGFMAYLELIAGPINRFGGYHVQWQTCRGVAERILDLLAEPTDTAGGALPASGDGVLALQGVSFAHPGSERDVLRGVSLQVAPGEHVALVGRNGSGKSTLFDLLLRFHAPRRGHVSFGGVDIAGLDVTQWRRRVGLMLQDTVLLHGTLAENLAIARPEASPAEMTRALVEVGAGPLLARLPKGLDSLVGERGAGLSGGERQLVGLARLVLRDPAVLLLDEPTAHLDGAALRTVRDAIARFAIGRTLLLITHDPDMLSLASRVILLEDGVVRAEGTDAALRASAPGYSSLMSGLGGTPVAAVAP
jgi:ABC-type multidrug transport system fused ATPase/permease subunit